jgi:hypothetical protein
VEIRVAAAFLFPAAWAARAASAFLFPVVASAGQVAWAHRVASEHREPLQDAALMPQVACLLALREQSPDQQAKEDAWADEQHRILAHRPAQLALRASGRSRARADAQHQAPRTAERRVSQKPPAEQQ